MMGIEIESTTDTKEQVLAAMGGKSEDVTVDQESAHSKDESETQESETEDSETSDEENQESETSESDSDDESEESKEDAKDEKADEQKEPRKIGKAEKRIKRLAKKLSEKDERIAALEKILFEQKGATELKADQKNGKAAESDKKPNSDDFESHEDYVEALTDWKVRREIDSLKGSILEEQAKSAKAQEIQRRQKEFDEFKAKHDDFMDVIESVKHINYSQELAKALDESELGPRIFYELAKNADEFEEIADLSMEGKTSTAIKRLGVFEERLSQKESPKKINKKTKAPKPATPVGGRASGSLKKTIFDEDLPFSEYVRLREGRSA